MTNEFDEEFDEEEEKKELAFLEALRRHENEWVAIQEREGIDFIVGNGRTAVEAKRVAEAKGFPEAALFKVLPIDKGYAPIVLTLGDLLPQSALDTVQK